MKTITIETAKLSGSREDAHAYLQAALQLPDYYGKNLDALYDCLSSMRDIRIILKDSPGAAGEAAPDDPAGRFLRVFEDAAGENPGLSLKRIRDAEYYQLIALDMDGTALTDDKRMDGLTREAIKQAMRVGKEVVFCTGRPVAEVRDFLTDFPGMHYLLCESGALLYDLREKRPLFRKTLSGEAFEALKAAAKDRDICPVAFVEGEYLINEQQARRLADYHMGEFQELVLRIASFVDDVFTCLQDNSIQADKINLFHTSPQERSVTRQMILKAGVSLYMADGEISSLECTAPGVNKALGIEKLSEISGIDTDRMIMVGDAENDMEGLRAVGLPIAVGNASDQVKEMCSAVVADNEHSGCAEAICRYLLGV